MYKYIIFRISLNFIFLLTCLKWDVPPHEVQLYILQQLGGEYFISSARIMNCYRISTIEFVKEFFIFKAP